MSTDVDVGDVHRLSLDEYHRLIEAGAFDDFSRVELIDGLLIRKEMKSRGHENAGRVAGALAHVRRRPGAHGGAIGASLTLPHAASEPEPDLAVIPRATPRPYHPASAALVVEVSVTLLRRDLDRRPALYARAGVEEYWVVDVAGGRVVVHRGPGAGAGGYAEVFAVAPGERIVGAAAGLPALDVGELLRAADD